MNQESAELLAISGLQFIAIDPDLFSRFSGISGIEAHQLRDAAQEPGFLAGVLRFILAHEPTVLAFAQHENINPNDIRKAIAALPGGDDYFEQTT